jgi:hypothetical protein
MKLGELIGLIIISSDMLAMRTQKSICILRAYFSDLICDLDALGIYLNLAARNITMFRTMSQFHWKSPPIHSVDPRSGDLSPLC